MGASTVQHSESVINVYLYNYTLKKGHYKVLTFAFLNIENIKVLQNIKPHFSLLFDQELPHFHFALQILSPVFLIMCEAL